MSERQVVVFWDAPPAINVSGFQAVEAILAAAERMGAIRSFKYYVDIRGGTKGASSELRCELKCAGVTIVDTASNGREGSAAKMMLTDAFVYALDNHPPQKLLFVSGDPDVCYAISLLRARGYQLPGDFDGSLFETSEPPSDTRSESHPPEIYTVPGRSAFGHFARRLSTDGRGNPEDPSSVLPSIEIDEFRQRFGNRRPTLDTGIPNPFRTSRRSSSPSGNGAPLGGVMADHEDGITLRRRTDGKGKGKARETNDSPVNLSASSFSSRTNSFDSYIMPPSISTAPTSAVPFYGSGSKIGDMKYQGLLDSVSVLPPSNTTQIQRSTSENSNDSGTATIIAASTPSNIDAGSNPAIVTPSTGIRIQQPSPRYDARPSFLPPSTPERIQVRATPGPRPTTATQAGQVQASYDAFPSGSTHTTRPTTPSVLVRPPSPVPTQAPVSAAIALRNSIPPTASTSMHAPAAASSRSCPLASNSQSTPLPVPSHFQHLIHVLRDFRDQGVVQVERHRLCQELLKRDSKILVSANVAQYRKPFALYFEDAHEAGITDSPTGNKVVLAKRYR